MATEVLLTADLKDVGSAGDVVRVSEGFARNYLFPKNLASVVNEGTRRRLAKAQAEREVLRGRARDAAKALAARVSRVNCQIRAKAAKDKKLYGSVAVTDIIAVLKDEGITLTKEQIALEAPIKELGVFSVTVTLDTDVQTTLKVWVVEG